MASWVYGFERGRADGAASMSDLLGGKGANLAEMARLGLPVPPGFTITTAVCTWFYANGSSYPNGLIGEVRSGIAGIEAATGRVFGGAERPLLVSVRSGSRASMPGMLDTVLDLGLNDESVEALAREHGDEVFALDSYRRFIQMYADVVLGVDHAVFEEILDDYKDNAGLMYDTDLSGEDLRSIVDTFKRTVREETDSEFPQDPQLQLWGAISAVLNSWMNARAIVYRKLHQIPEDWGTAVNVQAMVFGNMGGESATGVAFTRDPSTGENRLFGEFLLKAQGEDVVSGLRTPQYLTEAARRSAGSELPSLEELMPEAFAEFQMICARLERHFQDMQDVEFTIERGKLWMLQTRTGKRSAEAAMRIAVDMAEEGLISTDMAIQRIDPGSLEQLLHPTLDENAPREVIAVGLPASPGGASGRIVFSAEEAEAVAHEGHPVILVRTETSPEDIHGMHAAKGVLTTRGGMTSHAAVVARGMGKPCVSGAAQLKADPKAGTLTCRGHVLKAGDFITIDGTSGQIMVGVVPMREPEMSDAFVRLMAWADEVRRMKVRANAETPAEVRVARAFGAEGIGLCRTEHMFFDEGRVLAMREMILADNEDGRRAALAKLLPMQRKDFTEIFEIMSGQPVTIRLLDPPFHEFLPKNPEEADAVAKALDIEPERFADRLRALREYNPMLGHRGCRLLISHPEIVEMQIRAIFEAAFIAARSTGAPVNPEIMIPLIVTKGELEYLKARIEETAEAVMAEIGKRLSYQVGTMIELPRACLAAQEIAEVAEFFSFGTNDLTQTTFGISRDDAASFLPGYEAKGILPIDPFQTIDRRGVGELMEIGVLRGRRSRPDIKLGICGEQGGNPGSIAFCEQLKLDYVSCSPFRVPIARLAAAQATLAERGS
ncbi:Pyruvate, phosphate dikinase [Hartmannibacter diazotrophicus]|uniref:Pyruvate, phosphate dikinase n=1 Tax=Hartmannibacter diazotrophicus TaxID=1482074 RepID=A0A2C9D328_9HYPH|nr:pyruvate, phosphate dikinase [Hartmannibacter diazotrophicus]SON54712.1 Pyruvate, phosphate dikinase [Hartmannibacter diazotrophicus]